MDWKISIFFVNENPKFDVSLYFSSSFIRYKRRISHWPPDYVLIPVTSITRTENGTGFFQVFLLIFWFFIFLASSKDYSLLLRPVQQIFNLNLSVFDIGFWSFVPLITSKFFPFSIDENCFSNIIRLKLLAISDSITVQVSALLCSTKIYFFHIYYT